MKKEDVFVILVIFSVAFLLWALWSREKTPMEIIIYKAECPTCDYHTFVGSKDEGYCHNDGKKLIMTALKNCECGQALQSWEKFCRECGRENLSEDL